VGRRGGDTSRSHQQKTAPEQSNSGYASNPAVTQVGDRWVAAWVETEPIIPSGTIEQVTAWEVDANGDVGPQVQFINIAYGLKVQVDLAGSDSQGDILFVRQRTPASAGGSGLSNNDMDIYTSLAQKSSALQTTVIQYGYDPLYRLTGAVYTGAITATYDYVYDAVGNMTAYTETVGAETTSVNRTFNAANQLVTSTDTELGTTSFYYDGNGNLVDILPPGVVAEEDGAIRYGFNQRNLLVVQETYLEAESDWVRQAEFVYDGDGNRLQQIDHTGSQTLTTTYTNDIVGLSQVLVSSERRNHHLQPLWPGLN
jgi:YD repeat-containing protein